MRTWLWVVLALPAAACGTAGASPYDSSDDVQCTTLFGIASAAAQREGSEAVADEMTARIIHFARSNGGPAWLDSMTERARSLAAGFEAAPDKSKVMELFDACRARQDRDPTFRKAAPALWAEARQVRSR